MISTWGIFWICFFVAIVVQAAIRAIFGRRMTDADLEDFKHIRERLHKALDESEAINKKWREEEEKENDKKEEQNSED